MSILVMKFGGTSVADAKRMLEAAAIVVDAQKKQQVIVVVSAMAKVTDRLVAAAGEAEHKNHAQLTAHLHRLHESHIQAARGLGLSAPDERALVTLIEDKLDALKSILHSVEALGELTPRALDLIVSFGERMNIHLVSAAIRSQGAKSIPVEAGDLIVTTAAFGDARPLLSESAKRAKPRLTKLTDSGAVPVVTGYIGATPEGITTTLGRGGSDYSATILGYCVDAKAVWIWTDVDGVMTADPRVVPGAHTLSALTYTEAAELSYFGAKVLHPLTIVPAARKNIPVFIKNTFNPSLPGTKISKAGGPAARGRAITTVNSVALITVQGKGMIGVPGVAAKVFSSIAKEAINVLFISQASSEYNISLVVRQDDARTSLKVLQAEFRNDLTDGNIESIMAEDGLAIVAIVGEGMKGTPGIAGTVFTALGNAGVNVIAIAQGSSEYNISLVTTEADVPKAVKSIHNAFHLS